MKVIYQIYAIVFFIQEIIHIIQEIKVYNKKKSDMNQSNIAKNTFIL